jgi:hypothetical protein
MRKFLPDHYIYQIQFDLPWHCMGFWNIVVQRLASGSPVSSFTAVRKATLKCKIGEFQWRPLQNGLSYAMFYAYWRKGGLLCHFTTLHGSVRRDNTMTIDLPIFSKLLLETPRYDF